MRVPSAKMACNFLNWVSPGGAADVVVVTSEDVSRLADIKLADEVVAIVWLGDVGSGVATLVMA